MSIKEARLLIRKAFEENNETDRKGLLALADKLLADIESIQNTKPESIAFPLPIFRRHKGQLYKGQLLKGWQVAINGDIFGSPSAAAVFVSGHPENGWRMWRYIDEVTNSEQPIDRLRRMGNK